MTVRWEDPHVRVRGRQPVQVLAGLVGLFYLVIGAVGFGLTGFADLTAHDGQQLLGFLINPLHNLVHVVIGVLGLLLAVSSALSRLYGWLLFAGFGFLAFWGISVLGMAMSNPTSTLGNPLDLNGRDNWLHIATALLGLVIAIMPARKSAQLPVSEHPTSPAVTVTPTEERPSRRIGLHRRGGAA